MKWVIIKLFIFFSLIFTIIVLSKKVIKLSGELDISRNNEKAYIAENLGLVNENIVFKLNINQLKYYADSLTIKLRKEAEENNIKARKIKALQYQLEHFHKVDSIFVRDTIFREPSFVLDTCIRDSWNTSCLHLAYPGTITLSNEYNNEKYITLHSHKEPIKPRKWFLSRWFTRKHTIVEVLVVDKNPYVTTPQQRYIEIIDN